VVGERLGVVDVGQRVSSSQDRILGFEVSVEVGPAHPRATAPPPRRPGRRQGLRNGPEPLLVWNMTFDVGE